MPFHCPVLVALKLCKLLNEESKRPNLWLSTIITDHESLVAICESTRAFWVRHIESTIQRAGNVALKRTSQYGHSHAIVHSAGASTLSLNHNKQDAISQSRVLALMITRDATSGIRPMHLARTAQVLQWHHRVETSKTKSRGDAIGNSHHKRCNKHLELKHILRTTQGAVLYPGGHNKQYETSQNPLNGICQAC